MPEAGSDQTATAMDGPPVTLAVFPIAMFSYFINLGVLVGYLKFVCYLLWSYASNLCMSKSIYFFQGVAPGYCRCSLGDISQILETTPQLKGPPGPQGSTGADGTTGAPGKTVIHSLHTIGNIVIVIIIISLLIQDSLWTTHMENGS
jgi:ABC-type transport system involved in multi-copper enzyme maturation permease subunit